MDEEWSGALNAKKNETINGSGVYVDVENLQGEAQELMSGLMFNWPDSAPPPSRLTLYVRADQTELWYLWALDQFENVEVVVKGIQHFSRDSSKNSADIAIATNAITDFVRGRISYVVVFSDDSDFISLYSAIRDEVDQTQGPDSLPLGSHRPTQVPLSQREAVLPQENPPHRIDGREWFWPPPHPPTPPGQTHHQPETHILLPTPPGQAYYYPETHALPPTPTPRPCFPGRLLG